MRHSERARREFVSALVLLVIAVVVVLSLMVPLLPARAATNHDVNIVEYDYSPKSVDVAPGDTVTWHNIGSLPHTVTSNDSSWTEIVLNAGQSSSPVTMPSTAGTYLYHCSFHFGTHPTMWGAIVVTSSIPEFSSGPMVVIGLLVVVVGLMLVRRSR